MRENDILRRAFCCWAISALIVLCAGGPVVAADASTPVSLRLVPEKAELWGADASQRFVVLAKYSDRLERDVTSQSRLSVSDSNVARVDESGRLVAQTDGEVVLAARFADLETEATARVSGSEERRPFSFARDIAGIFTRRECNNTECHGSVKGKGGFKLSYNALFPKDDHYWIVNGGTYQVLKVEPKAPITPRVDLEEPEKSLLLLKPTMSVAHGGGPRLEKDSADYQTILSWIRAGAPYEGEKDPPRRVTIERIEVFPQAAVLEPLGQRQLLVTAFLSNGRREDITGEVLYTSKRPDIVRVTARGLVEASGSGETNLVIRAAGHSATAQFAVVERLIPDYPEVEIRNFIDEYVSAKLRRLHIVPSELSSDAEFLRRVCLDITGTLPPPHRVREFLADSDPGKRDKLIEILLNSPEYVDYWTFRFSDLFRVDYNARQDVKSTHLYQEWIRDSVARNKPYDQIARERIAAQGNAAATQNYFVLGFRPPEEIVAEQARVFLGVRLDCAQCHNHPFQRWSQDQFWGLAAFFSQMTLVPTGSMGSSLIIDEPGLGKDGGKAIHPRKKDEVQPRFLDGKALPEGGQADPRAYLAEWVTSLDNPFFARASVNRMWGYFFPRGIVEPVDDFRTANPPTHPELLDALAEDFKQHGYDLKHLVRRIVQSRTYQLSGRSNETNRGDTINCARSLPRRLDAEVLLDAISQVTEKEEEFYHVGHPLAPKGKPAVAPPGTRAIHLVPELFPSRFLDIHGRHTRSTIRGRDNQPKLEQALHTVAGSTYTTKLSAPGGRIDRLLAAGASNKQIVEEFYLAALTRYPTAREQRLLGKMIREHASRRQALESLVWGLVSSREFAYNH